nr:cysteine dioxygenase type 1-like; partial [Biomphalaria glabrata]
MNAREANDGEEEIETLAELMFLLTLVTYSDLAEAEGKFRRLMQRYSGDASDWSNHWTAGYEFYNRQFLLQNDKISLLLLIFPPRQGNLLHDHGSSSCIFKVLQGALFERYYRPGPVPEHLLRRVEITYAQGDLNASATYTPHCVRNLSYTEKAVSLVLYFPPLTSCHIYTNSGQQQEVQPIFGAAAPTVHNLHRLDGENEDEAEENSIT